MNSFVTTLWLGLRMLLLRAPPVSQRIRPSGHFWPLLLIQILSSMAIGWGYAGADFDFDAMGVQGDSFLALLTLASAVLAAKLLSKPVMAWSLAVLWMSAGLWLAWCWSLVLAGLWWWGVDLAPHQLWFRLAMLSWWLLILRASIDAMAADRRPRMRGVAALAAALLSGMPGLWMPVADYFHDYDSGAAQAVTGADAEFDRYEWPLNSSPETLLARQPALVAQALGALRQHDPERIDAYLLAFGGDGEERVFRNEVEYAQALFEQRFAMAGQTLGLINHPETAESRPLATLTNLRAALAGIAGKMDREEDLLILFMTSHGSEDHELYVDLLGLPLDQIDPTQLRDALGESGIRWKVLVVSACYSGGFVDALADSTTLVITAARSDRPSFGCGVDSDFTYFGRAYLIEALNQTTDLRMGFELAKERVIERETEEELDPSDPQIASTPLIEARLAQWREQFEAGPVLAWPMHANDSEDHSEAPVELEPGR